MKQRYYLNDVGEANKIIEQLMQYCQYGIGSTATATVCPLTCPAVSYCPFKKEPEIGRSQSLSGREASGRASQRN
jgi:hypothetical protein